MELLLEDKNAVVYGSVGGAVVAGNQLPDPLAAELLNAARDAFTEGLQLIAITSAAIVLGVGILALNPLRHIRPSADTKKAATVPVEESG